MKDRVFVVIQCPHTWKTLMVRKSKNGRWGFLGGKKSKKEKPMNALKREVFEESKIRLWPELVIKKPLLLGTKTMPNIWVYKYSMYYAQPVTLSKEHIEKRWFNDPYEILDAIRKQGVTNPAARMIRANLFGGGLYNVKLSFWEMLKERGLYNGRE